MLADPVHGSLQLDNGLEALLVYDPVSDSDSAVAKAMRRRLVQNAGGWQAKPDDASDGLGSGESVVAICVGTGSWSDPEELQACCCNLCMYCSAGT
jgi:hypothetical protein